MPERFDGRAAIYKDNGGYRVDIEPCSDCPQVKAGCPLKELQETVECLKPSRFYNVNSLGLRHSPSLEFETLVDRVTGSTNATGAICLKTNSESKDRTNRTTKLPLKHRKVYLNDGPKAIRPSTKE